MKKRKPKIIQDKKKRGEWAESMFLVRAGEEGLPASKPWGDSNSFDCVVGRPGKFVAVQVKCTIAKLESGEGYNCSVCSSHKPYPPGSFDFLAAYVILEDAWYIIPQKEIRGLKSISLCTTGLGSEAKYEKYREAWGLLRKASETGDSESSAEQSSVVGPAPGALPATGLARMAAAANYYRRYLEDGGVRPQKQREDV
jgi:PD-(D/E)XK endonuclease